MPPVPAKTRAEVPSPSPTYFFDEALTLAAGLKQGSSWSIAVSADSPELAQVAPEQGIGLDAIPQTLEILLELGAALLREGVDHPVLIAFGHDHPALAQISEVLGNFDLRFA